MGAAGVTAGAQTPATLGVGAANATHNRNALSGSNLWVLRVWVCGCAGVPTARSTQTSQIRHTARWPPLHHATTGGPWRTGADSLRGACTHGGMRADVPRDVCVCAVLVFLKHTKKKAPGGQVPGPGLVFVFASSGACCSPSIPRVRNARLSRLH